MLISALRSKSYAQRLTLGVGTLVSGSKIYKTSVKGANTIFVAIYRYTWGGPAISCQISNVKNYVFVKVPSSYQDPESYYSAAHFYTDSEGYYYIQTLNSVICKLIPITSMSFSEVSVDVSTLTEVTRDI